MDLNPGLEKAALELCENLCQVQAAPAESKNRLIDNREADKGAPGPAGVDGDADRISGLDPFALKGGLDLHAGAGQHLENHAVSRHLVGRAQ